MTKNKKVEWEHTIEEEIQKSVAEAMEGVKLQNHNMFVRALGIFAYTLVVVILTFALLSFIGSKFSSDNAEANTISVAQDAYVTKSDLIEIKEEISDIKTILNGDGSSKNLGLLTRVYTLEVLLERLIK